MNDAAEEVMPKSTLLICGIRGWVGEIVNQYVYQNVMSGVQYGRILQGYLLQLEQIPDT